MNKSAKTVMCMALVSCVSVLCVVSPAAGLVDISVGANPATWPGTPFVETYDPAATGEWGNGVSGTRQIGQSFQVSESVSATSAYFELEFEV